MTLQELERTLPNGLHDAELVKLHIDYEGLRVVLELELDVSVNLDEEERYRRGRITFSGVEFVAIDPPTDVSSMGMSMLAVGMGQPATAPCSLPKLPTECFLCWLFVDRSNSFIRLAARAVEHEWA
jgi:hypothetical protein